MTVLERRVTRKGQVTIPSEMRKHLGLEPHDRVRFEIVDDAIKITRAPSKIAELYGSITSRNRPEDFAALREEFETGVAEEVMGEKRP